MMNPEQREQVRLTMLSVLAMNPTKYGLPVRFVRTALANGGVRATDAEVEAEVQYLVDKGLAEEVTKILSPENQAWRITASGRDFLAQRGIE